MLVKPKLGISQCLLGDLVRYDGQHKRDQRLIEALDSLVSWVPVCPEVECGLSVPREPMHLVGDVSRVRLVTKKDAVDLTDQLLAWCDRRVEQLGHEKLAGFVFKSRSPSCGLLAVPVCDPAGHAQTVGQGLFAKALTSRFPELLVAEDEELHAPDELKSFIKRLLD
ncbi:MAG: DUF523 domain-containing protein [Deltaproteobacteria bacterium]|nr:DUF523 domain-containing protein [Deltaproteobacteria bacterium]MBW1873521.1 DUF523 domain-containing protein [Deltaproteobacteria bacterium]